LAKFKEVTSIGISTYYFGMFSIIVQFLMIYSTELDFILFFAMMESKCFTAIMAL